MSSKDVPAPTVALIAQLVQANADSLASTTNALLDGYRGDAETLRAELAAIRYAVNALLNGPYAPSAGAIARALYPSEDTIDAFRPDNPHFGTRVRPSAGECPYTHSHTRHWCGYPDCRDS